MTTATSVPRTYGELEGDDALATLRGAGHRRLLVDTVIRFRAADGFSHARALGFQITLTVLPALIAIVGLAAALDEQQVRRVVEATVDDLAPGPAGEILTAALAESESGGRSGVTALVAGTVATILAGTTTMAQVERGANRIYGVERDRPFVRRYLTALLLALSAGLLGLASVALLVAGSAIRRSADWGPTLETLWALGRWPVGLALVVAAVALLFEHAPRRRQPEASWLAFGAAAAAAMWLAFMAVLDAYFDLTEGFGATYGPIAGTLGVLVWAFLTSLAFFLGLAFAAQLEAVRAGVEAPRVAREHN